MGRGAKCRRVVFVPGGAEQSDPARARCRGISLGLRCCVRYPPAGSSGKRTAWIVPLARTALMVETIRATVITGALFIDDAFMNCLLNPADLPLIQAASRGPLAWSQNSLIHRQGNPSCCCAVRSCVRPRGQPNTPQASAKVLRRETPKAAPQWDSHSLTAPQFKWGRTGQEDRVSVPLAISNGNPPDASGHRPTFIA
jgi:hypothetical protein